MRRRLALVSLAITSLVVLAFLIPLATLVSNQAENRALSLAERDAQSVAAALAVAGTTETGSEITKPLAAAIVEAFAGRGNVSIIFPDGDFEGEPFVPSANIDRGREGRALTAFTEDGAEVLVPVLVATSPERDSTVVVRTFISDDELTRGVVPAWLMLGALGIFLVVVAVFAADRLGRSMVRPVGALSSAARSLGDGDLTTRVTPDGPEEVAEVGEAFNVLASRLVSLLDAERETVADLSHRLRTPLTALRLQAETLSDPMESASLLADIDRMERAVDRMIVEARRPSRDQRGAPVADLGAVVRHRASFWKVLADEQGRPAVVHTSGGELFVPMAADELGAVIDTLIENVFAHTPAGSGYALTAAPNENGSAVLIVEDDGPGFPDEEVLERGTSGAGSTGLGLDITRRAANRTGGEVHVATGRSGGAIVEITFGRVKSPK
jgi:signal transduction histidine kinase